VVPSLPFLLLSIGIDAQESRRECMAEKNGDLKLVWISVSLSQEVEGLVCFDMVQVMLDSSGQRRGIGLSVELSIWRIACRRRAFISLDTT
jgi:hypothetical protein